MAQLRTRTIRAILGNQKLRFSESDRKFLGDLARLNIITEQTAAEHCYDRARQDTVERSLNRLSDVGLLAKRDVVTPTGERWSAYEFADKRIAASFGGRVSAIGSKRTSFHECLVSNMYYQAGQPQDYRVESRFSKNDLDLFNGGRATRPDAMYTSDAGEVVLVEADSGQYTKAQIQHKMRIWRGFRQEWAQPANAFHKIAASDSVQVTRF